MKRKRANGCGVFIVPLLLLSAPGNVSAAVQGKAGVELYFLFDKYPWLPFMAAFVGIVAGAMCQRTEPFIDGSKVWRHDKAAIFSHWTHALGCALLLLSGFGLGFFMFPRLFSGPGFAAWLMNLHFIGTMLFVLGGFFWAANMVVSPKRFKEHLPEKGSLSEMFIHYAHLFKLTKREVTPGKYHGSERLAFVPIVLVAGIMIFTGFVKLGARMFSVSSDMLQTMTWLHDISTLLMLALFIAHVILGALVPWSWPLLSSMLRGYVPLKYAENNHKDWVDELSGKHHTEESS